MGRKSTTDEDDLEDDPDDAGGVEHNGPMRDFTPQEAMEISVQGQALVRQVALLTKREESTVKTLTKIREDRKSKIRDLMQLWADHQKGQAHLPFPDDATAGTKEPAPTPDETGPGRLVAMHGERKLSVVRVGPGSWAASVDGRLAGDGLEDAKSAQDFVLADIGVPKQLWSSVEWSEEKDAPSVPVPAVAGFVARVELEGMDPRVCRVWKDGEIWRATIDGNFGGEHPTKAKAQRWCAKHLEEIYPDATIPKLEWESEVEGKPAVAAPAAEQPFEDAIYVTKVGRKTAIVRQEHGAGKWTGRVGGIPIAVDVDLKNAQRICEEQITKGAKAATVVEWTRTVAETQPS